MKVGRILIVAAAIVGAYFALMWAYNRDPHSVSKQSKEVEKRPLRRAVERLQRIYEQPRIPRPGERLLHSVAKIHKVFTTLHDKEGLSLIEATTQNRIRWRLITLEAGLRFYQKAYPKMKPLRRRVKTLEDRYGDYGDARKALKRAVEFKGPAKVVEVLNQRTVDARAKLLAEINKGWLPSDNGRVPNIETMLNVLQTIDFKSARKDRKYVRKKIAKRIKKIEKTPYDFIELEGKVGLHAFRRDIRSIRSIYLALDGLIQMDPNYHPAPHYRESTFTFVKPSRGFDAKPIYASQSLFAARQEIELEINTMKSTWERVLAIASAFEEAGLANGSQSTTMALDLLKLKQANLDQFGVDAAQMLLNMRRHKLLKKMRRDFKRPHALIPVSSIPASPDELVAPSEGSSNR